MSIWDKYEKKEIIGYGVYGNIYKAINKKTNDYVAIREIYKKKANNTYINDIEIMKKAKNENCVLLKETYDFKEYFYIIMDLCVCNLGNYIKMSNKSLTINEIKFILIQINNSLKSMINQKIIPNNLKLENILISYVKIDKILIKLSDFRSKKKTSSSKIENKISLTIPPEVINGENDLVKCDLWSIGIIIYYMYFKKYPYEGMNEFMLMKDINSQKKLETIENNELNDLMNKLLKVKVSERISWEEYFNHPFFKNKEIELKDNENKQNNSKDYDIKLKYPLYTLSNHTNFIYCLTLLKDKRLSSGSADNSIIIYNKENYKPDIIIKEHINSVRCLTQLKNGILCSCSEDKTIKLFNIQETQYKLIQTLYLHSATVNKIIEISDNYLVSCSDDSRIILYIYEYKQYKKDYLITNLNPVINLFQINQDQFVYSTDNEMVVFFDLKERKKKSIIENISTSIFGNFCMISNDLLLIPEKNMISIINVKEYKKVNQINVSNISYIRGVCILNSNTLITSDNKTLVQWEINGNNLIFYSKKEETHDYPITVVLNLENGYIATASWDETIKIW